VHWYFYDLKKDKREERKQKREERRETRDKRRETRERESERARDERRVSEIIKVQSIIFLNRPGQNEKSADFTGKSGIVCI
jgi:hypothetical protein